MAEGLFDKHDKETYFQLCSAVQAVPTSAKASSQYDVAELAKGAMALDIDLGVILADDTSTVVCPLG